MSEEQQISEADIKIGILKAAHSIARSIVESIGEDRASYTAAAARFFTAETVVAIVSGSDDSGSPAEQLRAEIRSAILNATSSITSVLAEPDATENPLLLIAAAAEFFSAPYIRGVVLPDPGLEAYR